MSLARKGLGGLVVVAAVSVGGALTTGWWDPAAVRIPLAGAPRPADGEQVRLGQIDAAFRVEQRTRAGAVRWRLSGARLEANSEGLEAHAVDLPILELFRDDGLAATVRADRARVTLPSLTETGWVTLDLVGDVRAVGSVGTLAADELTVWIQRDERGTIERSSVRVRSRTPISVEVAGEEGARWTARASGLEGRLTPLELTLAGPIEVASSPLDEPDWASGLALHGRLAELVITGQDAPHPKAVEQLPEAITVTGRSLVATGRGRGEADLRADAVSATFRQVPLAARPGLGSLGGAFPAKAWRLTAGSLDGAVRGRLVRPRSPTAAAPPLRLTLEADRVEAAEGPRRIALTGQPARLVEEEGGASLEAPRIAATWTLGRVDLTAEGGPVAFTFVEPDTSRRGREDPIAWSGRAARVALGLVPEAAPGVEPYAAWPERLASLDASRVEATATARSRHRRRALRLARLRWDQRAGVAHAEGAPGWVRIGQARVSARDARYWPASERLVLEEQAALEVALGGGRGGTLTLAAPRAEGRLSADPDLWRADTEVRKELRRAGRVPPWPSLLEPPAGLAALELIGREGEPVRLQAPDLSGRADRLRYDRDAGTASLTARAGGPPVEVAVRAGAGRARRVDLARAEDPTAWRLDLRGQVEVGLLDPEGAPSATARADWAWARLLPPVQPGDALPGLERFALGGSDGVEVRLAAVDADASDPGQGGAEERVALTAGAIAGRGEPGVPPSEGRLHATLSDGWGATIRLPRRGLARVQGDRATLEVDRRAVRTGPGPNEAEEAFLRRALLGFEAAGGVTLLARGLTAEADRARLDPGRGIYRLSGSPAWLRREGFEHRGPEVELRLED